MEFSVDYFVWTMDVLNRSFCFFFFFFPPLSSEREEGGGMAEDWPLDLHKPFTLELNKHIWFTPETSTDWVEAAGPLSSCRSAFSNAWLKEFWKLGTGTRSDPSLSPSLSAAGGASSLSAGTKQYWLAGNLRGLVTEQVLQEAQFNTQSSSNVTHTPFCMCSFTHWSKYGAICEQSGVLPHRRQSDRSSYDALSHYKRAHWQTCLPLLPGVLEGWCVPAWQMIHY